MPYQNQDRTPAAKRKLGAVKQVLHVPVKMPEPVKIPAPAPAKA